MSEFDNLILNKNDADENTEGTNIKIYWTFNSSKNNTS